MGNQQNFIGIEEWHKQNNPLDNNDNITFGDEVNQVQAPVGDDGKAGAPATAFAGGPVQAGQVIMTGEGLQFVFTKHNMKKLV